MSALLKISFYRLKMLSYENIRSFKMRNTLDMIHYMHNINDSLLNISYFYVFIQLKYNSMDSSLYLYNSKGK